MAIRISAKELEVILKAKDNLSPELKKLAAEALKTSGATKKLAQETKMMSAKAKLMNAETKRAALEYKKQADAMKKADVEAKKLNATMRKMVTTLQRVALVTATYFVARAIGGIIKGSIQAAAEMEQARLTLESFGLTARDAGIAYEYFLERAIKTPLEVTQIMQAVIQLRVWKLATFESAEALENMMGKIEILAAVSKVTGVEVSQMIDTLGRLKEGIFLSRMVAAARLSPQAIREVMDENRDVIQEAFGLYEKDFGVLAEKISDLMVTKMSNIADAWSRILIRMGEAIKPGLEEAINYLIGEEGNTGKLGELLMGIEANKEAIAIFSRDSIQVMEALLQGVGWIIKRLILGFQSLAVAAIVAVGTISSAIGKAFEGLAKFHEAVGLKGAGAGFRKLGSPFETFAIQAGFAREELLGKMENLLTFPQFASAPSTGLAGFVGGGGGGGGGSRMGTGEGGEESAAAEGLEKASTAIRKMIDPLKIIQKESAETTLQINYFTDEMKTAGSVVTGVTETINLFGTSMQALQSYGEDAIEIMQRLEAQAALSEKYFGGGAIAPVGIPIGPEVPAEEGVIETQAAKNLRYMQQYGAVIAGTVSGGGGFGDVMQGVLPMIGTAIGGPVGGAIGGLLGGLFGKKKRGEMPSQPMYVHVVNQGDLVTAFLNLTKQLRLIATGPGQAHISGQLMMQAARVGVS